MAENRPPSPTPRVPSPMRKLHPWDESPASVLKPAHVYAEQRDWPGYFAAVAGKPARETLLGTLANFELESPGYRGFAIDFACGEGRDAAELLTRGWRVLAIDGHPEAIERIRHRPDVAADSPLEVRYEMMETAPLPACDLFNASFALPFCEPGAFDAMWTRVVASVRSGGRFAGQFFGERDSWASLPDRSHHTRAQVETMLQGFDVESFQEEEKDGQDAQLHAKHWHVFHVVARKR